MYREFYTLEEALGFAISAYRINNGYIKESQLYIDPFDKNKCVWPNKSMMLHTIDAYEFKDQFPYNPPILSVTKEDEDHIDQANQFFKKLSFKALNDDFREFDAKIFHLSQKEQVTYKEFGFIAYIPVMFFRDHDATRLKRACKNADNGYIGDIGRNLFDLDCEILEVSKSKNYDAYNVSAIIDNKIVAWMSSYKVLTGPAVIVRAKIKDHHTHFKFDVPVTRLHYVKAAQ